MNVRLARGGQPDHAYVYRLNVGKMLLYGAVGGLIGGLTQNPRAGAAVGALASVVHDIRAGHSVAGDGLGAASPNDQARAIAAVRGKSSWTGTQPQPVRSSADAVLAVKWALGLAVREAPKWSSYFTAASREFAIVSDWRHVGPPGVIDRGVRILAGRSPRAAKYLATVRGEYLEWYATHPHAAAARASRPDEPVDPKVRKQRNAANIVNALVDGIKSVAHPAPPPAGIPGPELPLEPAGSGAYPWLAPLGIGVGVLLLLGGAALALRR